MKRDKESVMPEKEPIKTSEEPGFSSAYDYRGSVRRLMETEVGSIVEDEIKAAAKELVEEQRVAIREAVGEHKRIIREVLEEEKLAIRARAEEIRASIVRLGVG
jgi:polyhydroxyalkanoate synthesis regulator phasin